MLRHCSVPSAISISPSYLSAQHLQDHQSVSSGCDAGSRFATQLVSRGASGARSAGIGLATTMGFWGFVLLLAKVRHLSWC